ncbi:MAG: NAD(P)/FAD-dependent oxidoreductase [Geminicoccaceae bacterium]
MRLSPIQEQPKHASYDVVIIGGAMMGSSAAWFLSSNKDFDGRVLVVERDPTYETASTSHTNSCIRQQFSTPVNIKISQFGAAFIKSFRERLGDDPEVPHILLQSYGYMYLAADETFAGVLRENQAIQAAHGAGTRIMTPDEIAERYPFYQLDDIVLGSHNPIDEGYFDGATMFDWWRRKARQNGVEYVTNEAVSIEREGPRITGVTLKSGETIAAGTVVNAAGPRAAVTAAMAGFDLPVEPRRRYTFIFAAEKPLDQDLPLTIDPSGVHMRSDGANYLCGCPPDDGDPAAAFDDFDMDHDIFERRLWPVLASRVPAFEAIKLLNGWVGHYAFNTLDQNAVIGPHPEAPNFIFMNGFSGHGLQQSPAMGRGVSELITYGGFRELDLSPLGYERVLEGRPMLERAVI